MKNQKQNVALTDWNVLCSLGSGKKMNDFNVQLCIVIWEVTIPVFLNCLSSSLKVLHLGNSSVPGELNWSLLHNTFCSLFSFFDFYDELWSFKCLFLYSAILQATFKVNYKWAYWLWARSLVIFITIHLGNSKLTSYFKRKVI